VTDLLLVALLIGGLLIAFVTTLLVLDRTR
jgi:hypothetical protein